MFPHNNTHAFHLHCVFNFLSCIPLINVCRFQCRLAKGCSSRGPRSHSTSGTAGCVTLRLAHPATATPRTRHHPSEPRPTTTRAASRHLTTSTRARHELAWTTPDSHWTVDWTRCLWRVPGVRSGTPGLDGEERSAGSTGRAVPGSTRSPGEPARLEGDRGWTAGGGERQEGSLLTAGRQGMVTEAGQRVTERPARPGPATRRTGTRLPARICRPWSCCRSCGSVASGTTVTRPGYPSHTATSGASRINTVRTPFQ